MYDCNKADTLSCDKIGTELDIVGFPGAKRRMAGRMGGFEDTAVTVFPLVTLFLEPS